MLGRLHPEVPSMDEKVFGSMLSPPKHNSQPGQKAPNACKHASPATIAAEDLATHLREDRNSREGHTARPRSWTTLRKEAPLLPAVRRANTDLDARTHTPRERPQCRQCRTSKKIA